MVHPMLAGSQLLPGMGCEVTPQDLSATLSRLGLSQAEAARLLGVTPGAVTRWVKGERPVPGPVARLLWLLDQGQEGRVCQWLLWNQYPKKHPSPP